MTTNLVRASRRSFLAGLGAVGAGLSFSRAALADEEKRLNFYNWDTYIGETTLADFAAATGIAVKMDLFGDNGELFAKIREGNPGYDVIVPSNDYVDRMWRAGLLSPLDHARIPNFAANVAPEFQDADFDPGRKYSMPYMWGTMGVGYRKSRVDVPVSWSAVWGEESARYAGRIAWISEGSSMLGMTLKYLGYSFNSRNPDEIRAAADQLIKFKKNVKVIADDNGQDLLASGEVDLCVEWSGDIAQLVSEDDDVDYVVPREGSYVWEDCLCVPTGAPHPMNAHAFLDFLLGAEVGRDLAEFIEYATPNAAARALMDASYRDNPITFPPEAVMRTLEPALYLGEERSAVVDEEWTRVLAA